MNSTLSSRNREQELRLKMDQRTLVEQEFEIRYLRRRLEKLNGGNAITSIDARPASDESREPIAA